MRPTYAVVGGGLAGAKAVETLRGEGFDGRVVLVCGESELPYERPALSKGYLQGKASRDSVAVHDAAWYEAQDVELLLGTRATTLDPGAGRLSLGTGESLTFDRLLLATGSSPRRVNTPGVELAGVRYLRDLADSDALMAEFSRGRRHVVLIGGGWIGLEVAAVARQLGNEVTVVEAQKTVLNAVVGDELGTVLGELHTEHGVRLMLKDGVESIHGVAGRVTAVATRSGAVLPADVVVIGIGARPNVELALTARLDLEDGVLVDESMQTSHPTVWAAGDIANAWNPLFARRIRVEHWANALNSGPAAARSMLDQPVSYDRVPYFYSDQYDLGLEYSGSVGPDRFDRIIYRGDLTGREFVAFWTLRGQVLAGMNVNVWDVTEGIQALVRSGVPVDLDRLADPDVPLDQLLPQPA